MQNIDSPIIEQTVSLMQSLPLDKQKIVMDYIQFLVTQSGNHHNDEPKIHNIVASDISNLQYENELRDLFGMVKTDKNVSLEDMDSVIRQRGAGL